MRSAYFNKEKIFLDLFWTHLFMKQNQRDRLRRIKFFAVAIDLIMNCHYLLNLKIIQIENLKYYIVLPV